MTTRNLTGRAARGLLSSRRRGASRLSLPLLDRDKKVAPKDVEAKAEERFKELSVPSLHECRGYQLPTRAEYEYAARGGTMTEF